MEPTARAGARRSETMAPADPWDAVVEKVTGPAIESPALRTPPKTTRPTPTLSGRPFTARPHSIRCVKERAIAGRRLYAVTFDDQHGYPHQWLAGVEEDETGWAVRGGAGGGGHPPASPGRPRRLVGRRQLTDRTVGVPVALELSDLDGRPVATQLALDLDGKRG